MQGPIMVSVLPIIDLNDRGSALEQYEILESLDPEIAKKLFVKLRRP
jgi:hypothetical protein